MDGPDLCDDPRCYETSFTVNEGTATEHAHIPEHDFMKLRITLLAGERPVIDQQAKKALQACRMEYFQTPIYKESEDDRATRTESTGQNDALVAPPDSGTTKELNQGLSHVLLFGASF